MIPKIIHYCWFGGNPMPEDTKAYIAHWRELCPDYEIREWNEENFDVNSVPYVKQAYECRKWAFVTDYVRLYALYTCGGVYMDTDVEMRKPFDAFLDNEAFSGFEGEKAVATGILGSVPGQKAIRDWMDDYTRRRFLDENGKMDLRTNVEVVTKYFTSHGLKLNNRKQTVQGFTIYPRDYFSPKDSRTLKLEVTENTCTIHHFAATWMGGGESFSHRIKKLLGPRLCGIVVKVLDRFSGK